MTAAAPRLLNWAAYAGLVILAGSMALSAYRIVRGPSNADRIVALDLLSVLVVALIALYAIFSEEETFLDVATAYALVAFLGTVAFARYLERSTNRQRRKQDRRSQGVPHE